MSAFVVGYDHIDALLTYALAERQNPVSYGLPTTGNRIEITEENATKVGRILLAENERSVRFRYPNDPDEGDGYVKDYTFSNFEKPLTPVAVLNGCDCFDYQACETDDYKQSVAYQIIDAIRHRAIRNLPGMENAPGWEFRR